MNILLLSNGHGEDLSGALLGEQLQSLGATVAAMALVGRGEPYQRRGISLIGGTHQLSTGGLGYTNLRGQLTEILEGQPLHLWRQLRELRRQRRRFDLIVAIGDLVPVIGAWLSGRAAAVYLVAYSSHYEGRLRLPWPCGPLLRLARFRRIWSRDALTAADLSRQLARPVEFVGNPFFDLVVDDLVVADLVVAGPTAVPQAAEAVRHEKGSLQLSLLPGSRLPEALVNLALLLKVVALLPADTIAGETPLRIQAALVAAIAPGAVRELALREGWCVSADGLSLSQCSCSVSLIWDGFAATLQSSDLVLSMAGTATEQAVGLGLPVVQVAGPGPQFTPGFADAQRRLLGHGVHCAAGSATAIATLEQTARICAVLLQRLADPDESRALRRDLQALAAERIGSGGGSRRMARAILAAAQAQHHG